jgi:hypothetical protein
MRRWCIACQRLRRLSHALFGRQWWMAWCMMAKAKYPVNTPSITALARHAFVNKNTAGQQ